MSTYDSNKKNLNFRNQLSTVIYLYTSNILPKFKFDAIIVITK
jgi:hypothetical protein